jgi:hypothetical protein
MKRKHGIILLVLAVILAYLYLNRSVREGLEEAKKAPKPSNVPIGPPKVPVEPIAPR